MIIRDMWLTGLSGPSLHRLDSLATRGPGLGALRRQPAGPGRRSSKAGRRVRARRTPSL